MLPKNGQVVKVKLKGEKGWEFARYYKSHTASGNKPGFDLKGFRFCSFNDIQEWKPSSEKELEANE